MGCGCGSIRRKKQYEEYNESNREILPQEKKKKHEKKKKLRTSKSAIEHAQTYDDVPSKPRSAPAEVGNSESSEDETGEYSYDEHETRQMRLRNVYLKSLPSLSYLENEIARILAESPLKPHPVPYISTFAYDARSKNELSFREGEKLQLFDDVTANWCKATFHGIRGASVGYVPASHIAPIDSVEANPWFFPITSRSDAERTLMHASNNVGAFLVRAYGPKENYASYVLSVRIPFKVAHFLILGNEKTKNLHILPYSFFPTLPELIQFYRDKKRDPVPQLRVPCVKSEAPHTPGLSQVLEASWEIPRSSVDLVKKLGEGNFGEVYEGMWNNVVTVAVKKLKKNDELDEDDFMHEVNIMKKLIHPKIVQLYGISTAEEPFYIITEFLKNGDLLTYLRKGDVNDFPEEKLVDMGAQIANGMEYLESMHFIHRDLAARNILVGNLGSCKIADFGLARFTNGPGMYIADKVTKLPLKWCAPESLRLKQFTTKSDVWSFGVVLVEIIERGMDPYPGMGNLEVFKQVCKGYVMPISLLPRCPEKLYNIMQMCWEFKPVKRPTFKILLSLLEKFYDEEHGYEDIGA